jgi:hypothetical protein
MDEQEHGQLLLEEKTGKESVARQQSELKATGELLTRLGNALRDHPNLVNFSNTPGSARHQAGGLPSALCFNFQNLPNWEVLIEATESLRDSERALQHTQTRLGT